MIHFIDVSAEMEQVYVVTNSEDIAEEVVSMSAVRTAFGERFVDDLVSYVNDESHHKNDENIIAVAFEDTCGVLFTAKNQKTGRTVVFSSDSDECYEIDGDEISIVVTNCDDIQIVRY